ncbi:hypothetical protein EYZ11_005384 [Aspergillus tanneri]|uniref:HAUS augmin-like complex subunit 1 n=1 Tax=Aspergillus tanneri TaxID=1220188 RepID=A0A4S3JP23_9EURO|nr:uncharacterized protein ATNIH1004_002471 [Aspergillus tanneri]KAA8649795.1 hypothetical protein ATNIH1004_002471 [Aspergillus tanneri]THC95141.1 hypothetical protein EYZ11_005384 [Aspergillus tanneri]
MESPLVSPTKARQAAIQAKDWAYVNSWLSRQYGPNTVPNFERNEDTLRTLLALAAANDAADEEATLIHHAREQGVQGYKRREGTEDKQKREILDEVELCLDGKGAQDLDDLAETTAVLGALGTETTDLGQSIIELTKEEFGVQQQMFKVETIHNYLERELATLQNHLEELNSDKAYEIAADLPALTAEWSRGTKTLTAKVGEYHDRIASLERTKHKGPTLDELEAEEADVTRFMETVQALENRVHMFHDLPKDIPGARAKYKELEQELDKLTQRRDSMFENLVDKR